MSPKRTVKKIEFHLDNGKVVKSDPNVSPNFQFGNARMKPECLGEIHSVLQKFGYISKARIEMQ